jgi:hypothetical protein
MIRMLKGTKDSAMKARTQAVNQMKAVVVTAPVELRAALKKTKPWCAEKSMRLGTRGT